MISNSLKTFVCSLLLFTLAQAQSSAESTANLSQFYSQLQGTYWSGTFEVSFKLAVGKANSDGKKKVLFHGKVAPHPIEISFLNQVLQMDQAYRVIFNCSMATLALVLQPLPKNCMWLVIFVIPGQLLPARMPGTKLI